MKELKYFLVCLWGDNQIHRLVKAKNKTDAKKKFIKHFTLPGELKPSYNGDIFHSSNVDVLDTIED